MYNPKYKKGDAIIRQKDSILTFSHDPTKTVFIDRVVDLNNKSTFYYIFKTEFDESNMGETLIPAIDVDKNYTFDEIYYRKGKLKNIIYNTNQNIENE